MDIFDKITNKINYRKFSNREKILFSILILLLTQLLLYNFLVKPKNNLFQEKIYAYENSKTLEEGVKYSGLPNFSNENISLLKSNMDLSGEEISKEKGSDFETLSISGKSQLKDINNISKFTSHYGFSKIDINREDENRISYNLIAKKPSEDIYYSDLKKEYFNKKDLNNNSPALDNQTNKVEVKNTEELKNSIIKNSVKQPKTLVKKVNNPIKNTVKKEIKKENKNFTSDIKEKTEEKIENNGITMILESDYDLGSSLKSSEEFVLSTHNDNVTIDNYDNNLAVININKSEPEEIIRIGLDKISNRVSFNILILGDIKEIGTMNLKGDMKLFNGFLIESEWLGISVFDEEITDLYFIPNDEKNTTIYIRELVYEK